MYITFARVPSDLTFSMEQRYSSPLYLGENKDGAYFHTFTSWRFIGLMQLNLFYFLYRFRTSTEYEPGKFGSGSALEWKAGFWSAYIIKVKIQKLSRLKIGPWRAADAQNEGALVDL